MNFCPSLRIENNCQNYGFNQVRMNGLEGPYSQILINSQSIYSGLMGVYGIELIPSNLDFNKSYGRTKISILAEGFYTELNDAFVNEYGEPDSNGVVIYTRHNAEKEANVYGLNLEFNFYLNRHFNLSSGFTMQKSQYEEV